MITAQIGADFVAAPFPHSTVLLILRLLSSEDLDDKLCALNHPLVVRDVVELVGLGAREENHYDIEDQKQYYR